MKTRKERTETGEKHEKEYKGEGWIAREERMGEKTRNSKKKEGGSGNEKR